MSLWMGGLAVRWACGGGRRPQEIPELMTQLLLSWGQGGLGSRIFCDFSNVKSDSLRLVGEGLRRILVEILMN